MKDINFFEKLKEKDLFKYTNKTRKWNKFKELGVNNFTILCYLIYNASHGRINISANIIKHYLRFSSADAVIKVLGNLRIDKYVKADACHMVKYNQNLDIYVSTYKSQYISYITKLIPYSKFQSLIKLGRKYWAVYCYLFIKYNTQNEKYITCTNTEIQDAVGIHRHTIKNIIIGLEVDGHLEIIRRNGSYKEGFGRSTPNLYKVLP